MNEIWKPVPGFEGRYEVSNQGSIRSLVNSHGNQCKEPRNLRFTTVSNGYFIVRLYKDGKQHQLLVHRLVAMAFIPNPLSLPCVNHKDECKTSNFVFLDENGNLVPEKSNLEWCTKKYNNNYGTVKDRLSKALMNRPDKSKKVIQLSIDGEELNRFPSISEASRQTGIDIANISVVLSGKHKQTHGYKWRYAE